MKKITLLAILLPAAAFASGYEVPNVNPRDLSLVSSAVASQRDAGATNVSPAALAKVDGLSLTLNGSILSLSTKWTGPAGSAFEGQTDKTNRHPVPPVALFVAYGGKVGDRSAGIGFGMGNPAGGNMFWDDSWAGRGRIITVERRVYGFYLTSGVELAPGIRVGGGPIYYYGTQYLKQGIQPVDGAFGELSVKGGGWAYEVSGEVDLTKNLTVAVDYKHKGRMEHSGDGNFVVPPGLESPATQDQDVKTNLTVPNLLNAGLAWKVMPSLTLTGTYSFSRFVVYKEDRFVGSKGLTLIVPRDYRNGNTARIGAEWETTERLTLRAGMLRDWSGLRTRTYSPTLPDGSAWAFGGGVGWKVQPNLALNAAGYFGNRDKVTSTDNRTATDPAVGSFPGEYKTTAYIVSVGFTWLTDVAGGK